MAVRCQPAKEGVLSGTCQFPCEAMMVVKGKSLIKSSISIYIIEKSSRNVD
jgi:hypothetical protein